MKKIRFTAVMLAIVLVAGSSFIGHKSTPTYYKNSQGQFITLPAQYHCEGTTGTCTYDENKQPLDPGTFVTP